MAGALPLPINTCTVTWRDTASTNGRLASDVRLHPQGGLVERCGDDCDDVGRGLSINLCNDAGTEDAPRLVTTDEDGANVVVEYDNPLRLSSKGCLWVKPSLGQRFKKVISAAVAQPATTSPDGIVAIGTPTTISITNDSAEEVCFLACIDWCEAFIDCPQGTPATAQFPQTDVEVTGSTIEASGDAQTLQVPARTITLPAQDLEITDRGKAGVAMRVTFNSKTCSVFAADNGYNAYSGRVCIGDVTVAAGATFTSDLVTDLIGKGTTSEAFTASTGELCVTMTQVACAITDC